MIDNYIQLFIDAIDGTLINREHDNLLNNLTVAWMITELRIEMMKWIDFLSKNWRKHNIIH